MATSEMQEKVTGLAGVQVVIRDQILEAFSNGHGKLHWWITQSEIEE